MVELLKQGQYMPYDAIDQCISILAGARGFLDDLKLGDVHAFERDLLDAMRGPHKDVRTKLAQAESFKGLEDEFTEALREFKANWQPAAAVTG